MDEEQIHATRLVVGARVRVRRLECRSHNHLGRLHDALNRGDVIEGILEIVLPEIYDHHGYGVRWGTTPAGRASGFFAASELEPLTSPAGRVTDAALDSAPDPREGA